MYNLIEIFIYLLAIMGLIFTSMSFFEIVSNKNLTTYKIFSKNSMKNKKIEIIINMDNIAEKEEEEIIDILLKGKYTNLEDVVDSVKVQKL